jgi:transcriptional regulator with XRE-family HTH domain
VGQPNELGALLADLRTAKGFSLREVEEATGKAVSNAYLSQLENGKIKKPSPNVLHSLAEVYAVPYETLIAEEEEELLKYLAFLRSRNSSS